MKKITINIVMALLCPKRSFLKQKILLITLIAGTFYTNYLVAQSLRITGTVESQADHKALAGATVKNGVNGVTISTDVSGKFLLSTRDTSGVLLISFIGYQTAQINFSTANQGPFHVRLKEDLNQLNEVVVSTGYQTLPKERATGSFVQLDSALINRRVSTDFISRLEGIVPGLLFNRNTSNAASGIPDINIRGHSTLFSNDQPLIVLDNFPYDGDINNINPNDIASITILKDAAAASIWGVRSGNGVIVITSKKGRVNQAFSTEFNTNVTIGNKPDLYYNPNFLDANDFINVEQTLFKTGFYNSSLTSKYQVVSPIVQILADQRSGKISQDAATSQIDALRGYDVRNDLKKYFFRNSVNQQYNLNFRGGGNKSDYYLSLGYDNDLANQVGNDNNRITISSNYNFYPLKNLQLSAGLNYTKTDVASNSTLNDINRINGKSVIYPYAQLADGNGNALATVKDFSSSFVNDPANSKFLDWNYRPLDELRNADNSSGAFDNRINLGLKYTFLKGFSTEFKYVYENSQSNASNYYNANTYYTRNLVNEYTKQNSDGSLSYPIPVGGIYQQANSALTSERLRGQLNYYNYLGPKNVLAIILGSEWSSAVNRMADQSPAYGYDKNTGTNYTQIDFLDYFSLNPRGTGSLQIPNGQSFFQTTDHFISYFSNAAYTYDEKYTISVSGRIDKSNLFGVNTNQKAVPLYSAGFSWDFSKEQFYHFEWLPVAKLRVTYGYNGNINKTATAVTTISQQSSSYYSGVPYAVIANPGNPDLQWEKDRMVNIGIDFGLKNQIITGILEYYYKNGINLFGNSSLAPSTGYSTFFGNTANTMGHGADIIINSRNIYGGKFKWQTSLLYSHVTDKVTKYNVQATTTSYLTQGDGAATITPLVNAPIFAIYSFKSAGLTHETGDPQGYLNGQLSTDYSAIIKSTPVSGLIYNGPSRPTTFGSLRNTFSYKSWSLSFNVIYKLGYYFRKSSIQYEALYDNWLGNKDFINRWQKPGDELTTTVPSMQLPPVDNNRDFFYTFSQSLVERGDHIRLQDISLNFDVPKSLWKNLPVSNLNLYMYMNNVGILWKANQDGLDPDVYSLTGGGATALPIPRTYALGLKANFK